MQDDDNNDNLLSEEEKRRIAVGQCSFMLISLYSTIAIVCGTSASSWCDFLKRDIILADPYNITTGCQELGLRQVTCDGFMNDHSVGLYSWQVTVPVDQTFCTSYSQQIAGVGWVDPDFDSKFNAVRSFSMIANVFGFFAWFTIVMASCCPLSQQRLNGLSCYFMVACLFQGLTLLLFRSDVCDVGFFEAYFQGSSSVSDKLYNVIADVECSLDRGGRLAIVATVFYFLSMNQVPTATVPAPIGYRRAAATDTTAAAAATTAHEEGATATTPSPEVVAATE